MPSLADLAKRARKGEKVKGGTEFASAEEGTEQYVEEGVVKNRRTLTGIPPVSDTPEDEEAERQKKLKKPLGSYQR